MQDGFDVMWLEEGGKSKLVVRPKATSWDREIVHRHVFPKGHRAIKNFSPSLTQLVRNTAGGDMIVTTVFPAKTGFRVSPSSSAVPTISPSASVGYISPSGSWSSSPSYSPSPSEEPTDGINPMWKVWEAHTRGLNSLRIPAPPKKYISKEAERKALVEEVEFYLKKYESRPLWREEDLVPPIGAYPEYYLSMVGSWDKPRSDYFEIP
jgi:hypothetical protein